MKNAIIKFLGGYTEADVIRLRLDDAERHRKEITALTALKDKYHDEMQAEQALRAEAYDKQDALQAWKDNAVAVLRKHRVAKYIRDLIMKG